MNTDQTNEETASLNSAGVFSDITGVAFIICALIHACVVGSQVSYALSGYRTETVFQQIAAVVPIGKIIRPADWLIAGVLVLCYGRLARTNHLLLINARNQVATARKIQVIATASASPQADLPLYAPPLPPPVRVPPIVQFPPPPN